jgi:hypothetical protein
MNGSKQTALYWHIVAIATINKIKEFQMKNKQVKGIGAAFAFVCGVVAISAGAPERELRGKIEALRMPQIKGMLQGCNRSCIKTFGYLPLSAQRRRYGDG